MKAEREAFYELKKEEEKLQKEKHIQESLREQQERELYKRHEDSKMNRYERQANQAILEAYKKSPIPTNKDLPNIGSREYQFRNNSMVQQSYIADHLGMVNREYQNSREVLHIGSKSESPPLDLISNRHSPRASGGYRYSNIPQGNLYDNPNALTPVPGPVIRKSVEERTPRVHVHMDRLSDNPEHYQSIDTEYMRAKEHPHPIGLQGLLPRPTPQGGGGGGLFPPIKQNSERGEGWISPIRDKYANHAPNPNFPSPIYAAAGIHRTVNAPDYNLLNGTKKGHNYNPGLEYLSGTGELNEQTYPVGNSPQLNLNLLAPQYYNSFSPKHSPLGSNQSSNIA